MLPDLIISDFMIRYAGTPLAIRRTRASRLAAAIGPAFNLIREVP
jgi:hypothetical protein